jgi:hypothetical protein
MVVKNSDQKKGRFFLITGSVHFYWGMAKNFFKLWNSQMKKLINQIRMWKTL